MICPTAHRFLVFLLISCLIGNGSAAIPAAGMNDLTGIRTGPSPLAIRAFGDQALCQDLFSFTWLRRSLGHRRNISSVLARERNSKTPAADKSGRQWRFRSPRDIGTRCLAALTRLWNWRIAGLETPPRYALLDGWSAGKIVGAFVGAMDSSPSFTSQQLGEALMEKATNSPQEFDKESDSALFDALINRLTFLRENADSKPNQTDYQLLRWMRVRVGHLNHEKEVQLETPWVDQIARVLILGSTLATPLVAERSEGKVSAEVSLLGSAYNRLLAQSLRILASQSGGGRIREAVERLSGRLPMADADWVKTQDVLLSQAGEADRSKARSRLAKVLKETAGELERSLQYRKSDAGGTAIVTGFWSLICLVCAGMFASIPYGSLTRIYHPGLDGMGWVALSLSVAASLGALFGSGMIIRALVARSRAIRISYQRLLGLLKYFRAIDETTVDQWRKTVQSQFDSGRLSRDLEPRAVHDLVQKLTQDKSDDIMPVVGQIEEEKLNQFWMDRATIEFTSGLIDHLTQESVRSSWNDAYELTHRHKTLLILLLRLIRDRGFERRVRKNGELGLRANFLREAMRGQGYSSKEETESTANTFWAVLRHMNDLHEAHSAGGPRWRPAESSDVIPLDDLNYESQSESPGSHPQEKGQSIQFWGAGLEQLPDVVLRTIGTTRAMRYQGIQDIETAYNNGKILYRPEVSIKDEKTLTKEELELAQSIAVKLAHGGISATVDVARGFALDPGRYIDWGPMSRKLPGLFGRLIDLAWKYHHPHGVELGEISQLPRMIYFYGLDEIKVEHLVPTERDVARSKFPHPIEPLFQISCTHRLTFVAGMSPDGQGRWPVVVMPVKDLETLKVIDGKIRAKEGLSDRELDTVMRLLHEIGAHILNLKTGHEELEATRETLPLLASALAQGMKSPFDILDPFTPLQKKELAPALELIRYAFDLMATGLWASSSGLKLRSPFWLSDWLLPLEKNNSGLSLAEIARQVAEVSIDADDRISGGRLKEPAVSSIMFWTGQGARGHRLAASAA
jgi:hypothetical protein